MADKTFQPSDIASGRPDFSIANANKNTAIANEQAGLPGNAVTNITKYSTSQSQYPLNLTGTPDLQHYIVFYINVRGASKYIKDSKSVMPIDTTGQNRLNRSQLGNVTSKIMTATAAAAGGYAGMKVGGTIAANVPGKVGTAAKVVTTLGAGAVGAAVGASAGAVFQPDQTFRTSNAIQLAVTERPSVKYGVDYVAQDMGVMGSLLQGGGSMSDFMSNKLNSELTRAALLNVAQVPAGLAAMAGSNFDPAAMVSVGTGTTPNPFREQMFKSVDNRTFNFDYKFLPRSAEEAKAVENIIYQFKFHMHPEISTGGYFYIYPSEFDIEYRYRGKQNTHVHKISTCVLTDMSVDYGGQSGFHSFADGSPTEINMRLQFRELEVLSKERIKAGY